MLDRQALIRPARASYILNMTTAVIAFAVGVVFLLALAAISLRSVGRRRRRVPTDSGPIIPIETPHDGDAGGGDG